MKNTTYNAIIYQEWDKYVAQCLEIDVASFGDSYDHALKMLKEAVELARDDKNEIVSVIHQPRVAQFDLSHA